MLRLAVFSFALLPFACSAGTPFEASPTASESALDTSGCSGLELRETHGAVTLRASRPPTDRCWNIDSAGLTVTYSWLQESAASAKSDVGFWVALNGAATFEKASSYACSDQPSGGLGHDTSGTVHRRCEATTTLSFGRQAEMRRAAYAPDGSRRAWAVEVAVALDGGEWDSLGGQNYRFGF